MNEKIRLQVEIELTEELLQMLSNCMAWTITNKLKYICPHTKQNKTKQNKTKQNKTKHNKTKQN